MRHVPLGRLHDGLRRWDVPDSPSPRERPGNHVGLVRAGAVVRVDQRRGVISVPHPLLQGANRHPSRRSARAEGVPQIVEAWDASSPAAFSATRILRLMLAFASTPPVAGWAKTRSSSPCQLERL